MQEESKCIMKSTEATVYEKFNLVNIEYDKENERLMNDKPHPDISTDMLRVNIKEEMIILDT